MVLALKLAPIQQTRGALAGQDFWSRASNDAATGRVHLYLGALPVNLWDLEMALAWYRVGLLASYKETGFDK